jgi:ribosomal protein S20
LIFAKEYGKISKLSFISNKRRTNVPNIKSAKKRVLVEKRNAARNKSEMTAVKTAIKKINNAIDTNKIEEAEQLLPATMSAIDSAVTKGIMHKNTAANKKSAIAKRISDIKSGKLVIEIKKDNKTIAAEKARAAKEAREAERAAFAQKQAEAAAAAEQAKKEAEEKAKAEKKAAKKTKAKKEEE